MQKKRTGTIVILAILLAIVAMGLFLYNSPMFERKPPQITLEKDIHWNLRNPIPLQIKDDCGVKFLRIILSDGENNIVLLNETYATPKKEIDTYVEYPKTGFFSKSSTLILKVEATDGSKWNMFRGNKAVAKAQIFPDTKTPNLLALTNSYKITKGGVALVAFKAEDENLKDVYIKTNFGHLFEPTPFYKEGYFVSLLAWPSHEDTFKAEIVAVDKAGNESKTRVKLFLENKRYRSSTIALKESFIEGKITDLAKRYARDFNTMDDLAKFKFVNETLRSDDEKTIAKVTSAVTPMPSNKRIT
ncbi:MAG: M23 family peptidase, partial [Campylobacteraceae bacterium]|nr:M23 family peptidase [Campylobacteraceae bacterium]